MPAGLLAVLAAPFGFDGILWRAMGEGIEWMIAVALWVASLPGALMRMAAFGTGALLVCTAGLLLLCLLRTPLRWCGAALVLASGVWAIATPRPDIRIATDGGAVAVRGADGRLAVMKKTKDVFAIREWLAADADARTPADETLPAGTRCDEAGCIAGLAGNRLVALSLTAEAFDEDCRRAALVVSPRSAPPACAAKVIDREVLRAGGAIELYAAGKGFAVTLARPGGHDRPWARIRTGAAESAPSNAGRPLRPDATPRSEDLDADD